MKKIWFLFPVVLAAFACNADDNIVNVLGIECEIIAKGDISLTTLARCPIVPELEIVQNSMPDSMFVEGDFGNKYITNYVADKSFIWVNVVIDDCGENTVGYRVLVKEPVIDGNTLHSVTICK